MKLHGNARLVPRGRALMCRRVRVEGWTVAAAAGAAGCSERTCYRWLARYDAGDSMCDRSSAPHSVPGRTPKATEEAIERLRRLRWTSTRIAAELGVSRNTVWNIERGNVVPDLHTTLQFCREIDVPIEALLSEVLA